MAENFPSWLRHYLATTNESHQRSDTIAYLASLDYLQQTNPLIAQAIAQELHDQRSTLKMIASENYSSLAVQLSMGNLLTDKYAEGCAGHRFYAGCDNIDRIEEEAIEQAKQLFGAEHAYVQPHSGIDANLVAFWSILVHRVQNPAIAALSKKSLDELSEEEYETIRRQMMNQIVMGMSLNSGGHLTHGYRHNLSAKMMRSVPYEVDPQSRLINYEDLAQRVRDVKPLILLAGYSSYPRLIDFARMREIADSVGAVLMVDMAHFAGLVAGKVLTGKHNPIPYADIVTSTTHKTLRGPRGGIVLCKEEWREVIDKGCPLVLGGPLPHVLAAKAIAFKEANTPEFCHYAQRIVDNARALAEALHAEGMVLSTAGTDNHLIVADVSPYGLTGRQAEKALREAMITVNRNAIPWDINGAWYTSGIRLGTPALTTRGMGPAEMKQIARCIAHVLKHTTPTPHPKTGLPSKANYAIEEKALKEVQDEVKKLLQQFVLYPELPDATGWSCNVALEEVTA